MDNNVTVVLGDCHGDWEALNGAIKNIMRNHKNVTNIVQVGDFGFGWPCSGGYSKWIPDKKFLDSGIKFQWLDGNHENFSFLEYFNGTNTDYCHYMPRGTIFEVSGKTCMAFGGAESIDKAYRAPYVNWWPQENITEGQLTKAINTEHKTLEAIFSHERPKIAGQIPYPGQEVCGLSEKIALNNLYERYNPKFWFFGHYHDPAHRFDGKTHFICCPRIDGRYPQWYTLWDGTNLEFSWDFNKTHKAFLKKVDGPYVV